MWQGHFLQKDFGAFGPPGRCEKTRKKHTPLTRTQHQLWLMFRFGTGRCSGMCFEVLTALNDFERPVIVWAQVLGSYLHFLGGVSKTNYYGKICSPYFWSFRRSPKPRNQNNLLWDRKSSLFLISVPRGGKNNKILSERAPVLRGLRCL